MHGIYFTIPVTLYAFEMLRKKGGALKIKRETDSSFDRL